MIEKDETEEYKLKEYGRCRKCNEIKKTRDWCNTCHFQKAFSTWTSGNQEIDYFIQNTQINAWNWRFILEWYPWELFSEIEKIGQGGYGTVFRAKSKRGRITWDYKNNKLNRYQQGDLFYNEHVALKTIASMDFMNEVKFTFIDY